MGQTIGLQRLEAFEIEQRLHHSQARGIAIRDRHDVGVERFADRGVARDRLLEGLADQRGGKIAMVEPRGDAMRHRAFERVVIENVDGEKQRELWLAPRRLFRFLTDARKQRIGASNPDDPGGQTLRHDETPKLDSAGGQLSTSLAPRRRPPRA